MALPARTHLGDVVSRGFPRLAYADGGPPGNRRRPPAVENGVLGMAIFLGTEVMVFAGLISAFLILRASSGTWPPPGQPRLPIGITGVNTLLLLYSAYTMRRAAAASRMHGNVETVRWLGATVALGTIFLLVQGSEWMRLLAFGLHASSSLYGATFYTLIGCHALHVLIAVIALLIVLFGIWRSAPTRRSATRLQVCQLYWFFVVAIWPVLYVLVYLS